MRHFPGFRRFLMERRGAVSIMTTLILVPVIAAIGLGLDYSRLVAAHTVLQGAVDAAALQAGAMIRESDERRREAGSKIYEAQIANIADKIHDEFQLNFESGRVTAEGSVTIPARILNIIGRSQLSTSVVSTITARQDQVSAALVLDVTGSLSNADLAAIKVASKSLVDIVLDEKQQTDHFISLVPFAQFVNIGTDRAAEAVLDKKGKASHSGRFIRGKPIARHADCSDKASASEKAKIVKSNLKAIRDSLSAQTAELQRNSPELFERLRDQMLDYDKQVAMAPGGVVDCLLRNPAEVSNWEMVNAYNDDGKSGWTGCVESRPEPNDVSVTPPSAGNPNSLFVPFFQYDGKYMTDYPLYYPNYLRDVTFESKHSGDKNYSYLEWKELQDLPVGSNPVEYSILNYLGKPSALRSSSVKFHAETICPPPITPLTHDATILKSHIDRLVHIRAGGTNVGEGIMWGWRTLIGQAPFPHPTGIAEEEMRKPVLVIMTDGENNVNITGGWQNTPFRTQYTPYGHAGAGHMPGVGNQSQANSYFNRRMEAACKAAKAGGIEVYTVLFRSTSTTIAKLLRECSTSESHAYRAADSAALLSVFREIARKMSKLYISG